MPKLTPIHPGEILAEEFLAPLGISQYRIAVDLGVPPRRINEIVLGRRGISADTALRLAHYFGNSGEFWMNLQSRFDLLVEQDRIGSALAKAPRHDSARLTAAQARIPYSGSKAKVARTSARRRS
jgi:addiction module HigA family antidote